MTTLQHAVAGVQARHPDLRVAETGCKSIVGQRLKQAGMHQIIDGADAIIALRCAKASSQREATCNTPHTQTRTA